MSTFEQFLATKPLGSAVGSTDNAVVVAAKDGAGNAAPLKTDATSGELLGKVSPAADQDPIFDCDEGEKHDITTSAVVLTPPVGCKYATITSSIDIVINTKGNAAVDNGTALLIPGGQPPFMIPVTEAVDVYALSLSGGTATVRCMPMKVR